MNKSSPLKPDNKHLHSLFFIYLSSLHIRNKPNFVNSNMPKTRCSLPGVFSIIELTAGDKPGMLYSILRTIKNLGLRIRFVKISTKRESVEDVFYVTKGSKGKIYDINEIENIRKKIMDVIK